jgi:hypothetical protein
MPLDVRRVGHIPKESPLETHAVLTWAMNFAAGSSPPFGRLDRALFDNTAEQAPPLHPLFFACTREVVGAWAALYGGGMTKAEVVRHTFVHHTYDAEFSLSVIPTAGSTYHTLLQLVDVAPHRAGSRFVTAFRTVPMGSDRAVGRSWCVAA